MTVYDPVAARKATERRFPVTFIRAADGCPVGAAKADDLEAALAILFENGNTRVDISFPEK